MANSITCPKCKRISFNQNDIEKRFCVECGYHTELPKPVKL